MAHFGLDEKFDEILSDDLFSNEEPIGNFGKNKLGRTNLYLLNNEKVIMSRDTDWKNNSLLSFNKFNEFMNKQQLNESFNKLIERVKELGSDNLNELDDEYFESDDDLDFYDSDEEYFESDDDLDFYDSDEEINQLIYNLDESYDVEHTKKALGFYNKYLTQKRRKEAKSSQETNTKKAKQYEQKAKKSSGLKKIGNKIASKYNYFKAGVNNSDKHGRFKDNHTGIGRGLKNAFTNGKTNKEADEKRLKSLDYQRAFVEKKSNNSKKSNKSNRVKDLKHKIEHARTPEKRKEYQKQLKKLNESLNYQLDNLMEASLRKENVRKIAKENANKDSKKADRAKAHVVECNERVIQIKSRIKALNEKIKVARKPDSYKESLAKAKQRLAKAEQKLIDARNSLKEANASKKEPIKSKAAKVDEKRLERNAASKMRKLSTRKLK